MDSQSTGKLISTHTRFKFLLSKTYLNAAAVRGKILAPKLIMCEWLFLTLTGLFYVIISKMIGSFVCWAQFIDSKRDLCRSNSLSLGNRTIRAILTLSAACPLAVENLVILCSSWPAKNVSCEKHASIYIWAYMHLFILSCFSFVGNAISLNLREIKVEIHTADKRRVNIIFCKF